MRIGLLPSRFNSLTASTASSLISRVLAQDNGDCSVEENTTLDALVSSAKDLSSLVWAAPDPDSAANPDISRYVFAPIKIV